MEKTRKKDAKTRAGNQSRPNCGKLLILSGRSQSSQRLEVEFVEIETAGNQSGLQVQTDDTVSRRLGALIFIGAAGAVLALAELLHLRALRSKDSCYSRHIRRLLRDTADSVRNAGKPSP